MQGAAKIAQVGPASPASRAGLEAGDFILRVDGHAIDDIIDWWWHSSEDSVCLSCIHANGTPFETRLERSFGQDWGITFADVLFDGTRKCVNSCTFCFMRQLPAGARASLSLRDDDFRLSFLQGNFVTFTNLSTQDEKRIIEQRISPLRFSLHAVTPQLRDSLIGPRSARGLEAAEHLLETGIELHAQIVLMPGVNDGAELERTLQWAYGRPGIANVGIVPVGYTKHQSIITRSFDDPASARRVLDAIEPVRQRALRERGHAWVHAGDEFYCKAFPHDVIEHLPPASDYGDFGMFEDGIGMVRSFVDDFLASKEALFRCEEALERARAVCHFICGRAQEPFLAPLLSSGACKRIVPLYVDNEYFGGNVNVTGLLCSCDIVPALEEAAQKAHGQSFAVLPSVVFNADGITLDGMSREGIAQASPLPLFVVSCQASEFLLQIAEIASASKDVRNG